MNTIEELLTIEFTVLSPRVVVASNKVYFHLNSAAIILDNFIVMIDAMLYPAQSRLFKEYLDQKYEIPIRYLFLTHIHGDHVFGMSTFKEAEVIGSQLLVDNVKNRLQEQWSQSAIAKWREDEPELRDIIHQIEVRTPTISLEEQHVITDGPLQIHIHRSGGHTSCSSWAYFPEDRIIFTGDELASFWWPFISDASGNPDTWIEGFEKMLALDCEFVVPGHGPIVDKDHLVEHHRYIRTLRELVRNAISEGKIVEEIEMPDFYKPAEDWQISEALEHLFDFYSK